MILECPECHTRYLVPDTAIGASGRTVRCANCRHSWFQEPSLGSMTAAAAGEPIAEELRAPSAEPPQTAETPANDVIPPSPMTAPPFGAGVPPPPVGGFSASELEPPATKRALLRNPNKRWTAIAIAAALVMVAAVGLILWLGTPSIAQRTGLFGEAESPLRLVDNPIERRELANGSELFAVSGKVLNPSATRQRVPDIRADLRDAQGRLVFTWTITPAQRTLGPRGSIDFNSATLDVPATSKRLELSFAGENGA